MAKSDSNKTATGKGNVPQGKIDRFLSLFGSAMKDLQVITSSVESVSKTVERRKTTDTENAVKISKAETDAKKEENRHNEAIANINLEYKRIAEASQSGDLKWSMIQDMVQMIKSEADKLTSMDDDTFLSEASRNSRDNLHRTIIELSKEIIRA